MITSDNISEVVGQLSGKNKKRLRNTSKEYAVLLLSVSNTCSWTSLTLTNDYDRYKNVSDDGDCILEVDDALQYLD